MDRYDRQKVAQTPRYITSTQTGRARSRKTYRHTQKQNYRHIERQTGRYRNIKRKADIQTSIHTAMQT